MADGYRRICLGFDGHERSRGVEIFADEIDANVAARASRDGKPGWQMISSNRNFVIAGG
jgi:hypothetical protein